MSITHRIVRPVKPISRPFAPRSCARASASSDEFTDGEGQSTESTDTARRVRRALVDDLLDVLDAREYLIDLQVEKGLDPLELRTSDDSGSATGRDL